MRFAGGTLSKGQGQPQANRRLWSYQVKDWRAAGLNQTQPQHAVKGYQMGGEFGVNWLNGLNTNFRVA
jgi:hypothetical protein